MKWIILKSAHFTPITLGKVRPRTLYKNYECDNFKLTNLFLAYHLREVCSSSFPFFFLSDAAFWCLSISLFFATLDVVLELCDLPTSLACLHCFLDLSLMLLVFVWCYVFNLNHWSAKRPVFLFSFASYNFIFKPLICKEICFAFSIFYNTIQSFVI